MKVLIPGRLVNKANQYKIHRSKDGRVWIAPSDDARSYESLVAWSFLAQDSRSWTQNEPLQLRIWLINQRHDCDAIKAILDGIQKSGRINNDKQFRRILVEHIDGKTAGVQLEVYPMKEKAN